MTIEQKSKVIAKYLGWVYVPHNNLKNFPKAGWYIPLTKHKKQKVDVKGLGSFISYDPPLKYSSSIFVVDEMPYKYVCRSHNQLRFYNSFDALIPVLNKLTEEDLREYMYSWEQCVEGDEEGCELETQYNFEYIGYDIYAPMTTIYINLTLDPAFDIGECKGEGIIKNTFEACFQAVEYINKIKNNEC